MTSYRKEAESPPRFEPDILAPSPEEQAGIINALDREQESIHSYCVSKEWYQRWRSYIGLPDQTGLDPISLRHQGGGSNSTPNTEKQIPRAPSSERRSSSAGSKNAICRLQSTACRKQGIAELEISLTSRTQTPFRRARNLCHLAKAAKLVICRRFR